MKRNGSLVVNTYSKLRSRSIESRKSNDYVISILKDPSKSNLKHNKSVHFDDRLDILSEESNETKASYQQQYKDIEKTPHFCSVLCKDKEKHSSIDNKFHFKMNNFEQKIKQKEFDTNKETKAKKNRFTKGISTKVKLNSSESSSSPKFAPKIINFQFRDQGFYEKLNKFIIHKELVSPKRKKNEINNEEHQKRMHYDTNNPTRFNSNEKLKNDQQNHLAKPEISSNKQSVRNSIQLNVRYPRPNSSYFS